jgi:2'-5' RNA ligase
VIISTPPPDLRGLLDDFRRPLNELVGAREALRYPPHITLRTGLTCPEELAEDVGHRFLRHAARFAALPVQTGPLFANVYGEGASERGMLAWPVEPTEALMALHRHLLEFGEWQKGAQAPYQPHVSAVYGDIGRRQLKRLTDYLASSAVPVPQATWVLDHVALFVERPTGWKEWGRAELRRT